MTICNDMDCMHQPGPHSVLHISHNCKAAAPSKAIADSTSATQPAQAMALSHSCATEPGVSNLNNAHVSIMSSAHDCLHIASDEQQAASPDAAQATHLEFGVRGSGQRASLGRGPAVLVWVRGPERAAQQRGRTISGPA